MILAFALGVAALVVGIHALREGSSASASTGQEPTFEPLTFGDAPGEAYKEGPSSRRSVRSAQEAPATPEDPAPNEPPRSEPPPSEPPPGKPSRSALPAPEVPNWPKPDGSEVAAANGGRDYGPLPSGAVLGLTIGAIGIHNAPVWASDAPEYLDRGVVHVPGTSMPWSRTPERNTYLAAHRLGYPGTESRLLFYNLDKLKKGNRIVLEDRRGRRYAYAVSQVFVVSPYDSWVMGRVRGRDMVSLQTCTPIPTFERRLIVRADRV